MTTEATPAFCRLLSYPGYLSLGMLGGTFPTLLGLGVLPERARDHATILIIAAFCGLGAGTLCRAVATKSMGDVLITCGASFWAGLFVGTFLELFRWAGV